jgi:hypothetical protein
LIRCSLRAGRSAAGDGVTCVVDGTSPYVAVEPLGDVRLQLGDGAHPGFPVVSGGAAAAVWKSPSVGSRGTRPGQRHNGDNKDNPSCFSSFLARCALYEDVQHSRVYPVRLTRCPGPHLCAPPLDQVRSGSHSPMVTVAQGPCRGARLGRPANCGGTWRSARRAWRASSRSRARRCSSRIRC